MHTFNTRKVMTKRQKNTKSTQYPLRSPKLVWTKESMWKTTGVFS